MTTQPRGHPKLNGHRRLYLVEDVPEARWYHYAPLAIFFATVAALLAWASLPLWAWW